MPRKKAPTNNDANPKAKVIRPLNERIEAKRRELEALERKQAMASLKDTEEGKQVSLLTKAADLLEELDEPTLVDDIRAICKKIAEGVGVELT